jgi:hypothetical protein
MTPHCPRSRGRLLVAALLALTGCGSGGSAEHAATGTQAAPPATPPAPPTDPAAGGGAAPTPPPERRPRAPTPVDPSRARDFRAALREGRGHMRAGRHAEAIAAFERALGLDPADPVVRSELGWALFNAGRHDEAAAVLDRAIRGFEHEPELDAAERNVLGAALYNRGRVAEAKGDAQGAASFYARSLAVRPNETVRARLAALGVATRGPVPAGLQPTGLSPSPTQPLRAPTLDALRAALGEAHCRQFADLREDGDPCTPTTAVQQTTRGAVGPITEVAVVVSESSGAYGLALGGWVALRDASGWHGFGPFTSSTASGVGGTGADVNGVDVRLRGEGAVLVEVELDATFTDADLGLNAIESNVDRRLVLCGVQGGAPRCYGSVPISARYERAWITDPAEVGDPEERRQLFAESERGLPIRRGWSVRAVVEGDRLRLTHVDGNVPPGLVGTYGLDALPRLQDR